MKVKLVEVTGDDTSWKGTWYRKGERHFVMVDPMWPQVMACKYRYLGHHGGGIHEHDCKEITGFVPAAFCLTKRISEFRTIRALEKRAAQLFSGRVPQ